MTFEDEDLRKVVFVGSHKDRKLEKGFDVRTSTVFIFNVRKERKQPWFLATPTLKHEIPMTIRYYSYIFRPLSRWHLCWIIWRVNRSIYNFSRMS